MVGIFGLVAAAALVSQSAAVPFSLKPRAGGPTVANPGPPSEVEITKYNTVNGTRHEGGNAKKPAVQGAPLKFSLFNNFGGEQLYAYVTGRDVNDTPVLLTSSGSWYYPNPAGSAQPIVIPADAGHTILLNGANETTEFSIPDWMSSGRVWVSEGELTFQTVAGADGIITIVEPSFVDPEDASSDLNWGFVELTNNEGGIYANISFVDFVGLVLSMRLTLGSGEVQTVEGLATETAVADICNAMIDQAAQDGQPWDQMCVTRSTDGLPLRILAPNMYLASNPGSMDAYWASYVDDVYAKYTNEDLIIDTQGVSGQVPCRVTGEEMWCEGDVLPYPKPTAADIFGCNSGPFANVGDDLHKAILARMCAAFHRSELLIDGGNVTPALGAEGYYTVDPTSHYSRLVHEYETDGLGYAFSYDDVNPHGENAAGVVAGLEPQVLEIFIGGMTF